MRPPGTIAQAERHAGRALHCRDAVSVLLGAAGDPASASDFGELLFLAKFREGAEGILRRTGPGAADVQKLSAELSEATVRICGLLGKLFDAGAPGRSAGYRNRFLPMEGGSLESFRELLSDLALLKNYELHGGPP